MVMRAIQIVNSFLKMPLSLKVISVAGLFSPLLALGSVLTGSILPDGYPRSNYGAASNLFELFMVIGLMFPAAVSAVLIVFRLRLSRIFFVVSYFVACVSPFSLKLFREELSEPDLYLLAAFVTSLILSGYMFLSKNVRAYCRTSKALPYR